MTANITRSQMLSLYKSLIRESRKFPSYNFRMFALRKIRDNFRINKQITDPSTITHLYQEGIKDLEVIKRQVIIGQLYTADKLVIENRAS